MPDEVPDPEGPQLRHRGRIQAQGGGVEESVSWARLTPPTEHEMLEFCDQLHAKLTVRESQKRERGFAQLRRRISEAALSGGLPGPMHKSWKEPGTRDVRTDLEV